MLPTYMVPTLVIGIDEWPRTGSGKIERKGLPKPVLRENTDAPKSQARPKVCSFEMDLLASLGCK